MSVNDSRGFATCPRCARTGRPYAIEGNALVVFCECAVAMRIEKMPDGTHRAFAAPAPAPRPPLALADYHVQVMMPEREIPNDEAERALAVVDLVMHDELRGLIQVAFDQLGLAGYSVSVASVEDSFTTRARAEADAELLNAARELLADLVDSDGINDLHVTDECIECECPRAVAINRIMRGWKRP